MTDAEKTIGEINEHVDALLDHAKKSPGAVAAHHVTSVLGLVKEKVGELVADIAKIAPIESSAHGRVAMEHDDSVGSKLAE